MNVPAFRHAVGVAALMQASTVCASFNSFGNSALCNRLDCLWTTGALLAMVVPPIFFLPFWGLSLLIGHAARSQRNKLWWAGIHATLCYALVIVPILMLPGRNPTWFYVLAGYVVLAACQVRWREPRWFK